MSRFIKELRVIPRAAWVVAWVVYVCITVPFFFFVLPNDADIGTWPRWGQALFDFGIWLFVVVMIALIGYVYGDAKRRHLRYVMWTLLAIFTPSGLGIILYFVLRDYSILPDPTKACPGCGSVVMARFPFCPHCGTSFTCRNCGKPVDPAWMNCAQCGQPLSGSPPRVAKDQGQAM